MLQSDIEAVQQPIPNMEMLDNILDLIDAHPERWDQSTWATEVWEETEGEICGTALCVAGHAVAMKGYHIDYERGEFYMPIDEDGGWDREMFRGTEFDDIIPEGMTVGDFGRKGALILGLTDAERKLFGASNDRHVIGVMVEEIRYRAKQQAAAFDRIAEELIASVPELEAVLKPGFLCPESQDIVLQYLKGNQDR